MIKEVDAVEFGDEVEQAWQIMQHKNLKSCQSQIKLGE
jgi:cell fate (sporulation/competence/biofilm development) regulator YmcA (YheA/YmcA/DUF963 family)